MADLGHDPKQAFVFTQSGNNFEVNARSYC